MKIELNKISQGPTLAKGSDSAGNSCGTLGTDVNGGCLKAGGMDAPGGGTSYGVTYSTPISSC